MPLSADTIKRRIDDKPDETLMKKMKASTKFSIQIHKTTDIRKKAQLLSVVKLCRW